MNTSGPKGISSVLPIDFRYRLQCAKRAKGEDAPAPRLDADAVVQISSEAKELGRKAAVQEPAVQEPELESLLEEYDVDSKKTAEALMKRMVPELYQALVDAGEIEE